MIVTTVVESRTRSRAEALIVGKAGDGIGISPLLTCAFPRYSQRIAERWTPANQRAGPDTALQSPGAFMRRRGAVASRCARSVPRGRVSTNS